MPILQFKGKTAIECYHHTVSHHTLEFDSKLSVLGKGETPGLDGNLIIEGDNLVALKALLPTHAGRIKCIYIDPPYNTGNEGWVYNDNLTQPQFKEWIGQTVGKEGEDATRHDKWCCMMYPRLQLLKELLRDDGAIFMSIDDNEVASLRMLMDEVFGEENRVTSIVRQTRISPDNDEKFITATHDALLIYLKSTGIASPFRFKRSEEQDARYENPDDDPRGPWTSSDLTRREFREHDYYEITLPSGRKVKPSQGRSWGVPKETFERLKKENRIWFGPDGNAMPRRKRFLSEVRGGLVPVSWWTVEVGGSNEDGKKEVNRIFSENPNAFPNPKPVSLIMRILELTTEAEDLVLDSFAGSGTTAHAVLELNKEDGGNRKFILVQQPYDTKENEREKFNICQKVAADRIRRVIHGYSYSTQKGKKEKVAGLGGSFAYARVGNPLFGEYRDWGKQLPGYEDLAKYIFYTETSRDFDRKMMNEKTGKIGEHHGTSYYLLYTPDGQEDRRLDMEWLKGLDKMEKNRNLVVYCEKIWVHRDDLAKFEQETKRTVRPMIVPFNLK